MINGIFAIFSNAGIEYNVAVLELIIDGIIVSAIWQVLSHFAGKKQEKHLEARLDELYDRIIEAREEAHEAREESN
jgi:hypothetical protein